MSISGPPRSSFGVFGGPGFILALLVALGIGGAVIYSVTSGRISPHGGASLSLPDLGNSQGANSGAQPDSGANPGFLQPLQPMAAAGNPAPAPAPAKVQYPIVTEELSPAEFLAKYPPGPALALVDRTLADRTAPGAAEAARYRRPSSPPLSARRLALVGTGLGLDRISTAQAILSTAPDVTLSFAAGSPNLAGWIDAARAYGHEALIDLQLGTSESLAADAGDSALLAELGPAENLRRLEAILARAPKAAGVVIEITDAFLGDAAALTPILERLQDGGWITVGLPVTAPLTVAADRVLDQSVSADAMAREARAIKGLAQRRGAALILGNAANAIALSQDWIGGGHAEIALVPASALVEQ